MSDKPLSPLRQRMIDDMTARRFTEDTQRDYVRNSAPRRTEARSRFEGLAPNPRATPRTEEARRGEQFQSDAPRDVGEP